MIITIIKITTIIMIIIIIVIIIWMKIKMDHIINFRKQIWDENKNFQPRKFSRYSLSKASALSGKYFYWSNQILSFSGHWIMKWNFARAQIVSFLGNRTNALMWANIKHRKNCEWCPVSVKVIFFSFKNKRFCHFYALLWQVYFYWKYFLNWSSQY